MKLEDFLGALRDVRKSSKGWVAKCPAHDDQHPSLSIDEEDGRLLVHCHAGCSFQEIMRASGLTSNGDEGLNGSPQGSNGNAGNAFKARTLISRQPDREYDYRDENGTLLYKVVRSRLTYDDGSESKQFLAKRSIVSSSGAKEWVYKLNGVRLVLYKLPEIASASLVYVVEGEKDVETLTALGLAATCNPFGAGKWRKEFNESLRGKTVAIIPDNDDAGRRHVMTVASSLHGIAKEVLVINLPGLKEKGDVTDFVNAGGTVDDLTDLVTRSDPWTMPGPPETKDSTSKFRFTSLSQLLLEPEEETSFVWDQTLPVGGLSICSAKPKVGKSTLARNLAVAVATGQPFLGRPTVKGRVLYLCLEEKRSEIRKHFEKMGTDSREILIHTGKTPEHAFQELAVAIAEFEPILVIIDPLSRVLRVRDFNDYAQMCQGLEPLIDLARRTNCHILACHHDSKMDRSGGDALLGSTAIFGAVDCHLQLKKRERGRTIATTQRYGEDLPETVVDLDKATGVVTAQGDLKTFILKEASEDVAACIRPGELLTEAQIKERVEGFSQGVISKTIRALVERGELNREGEGKRNKPFLYSKPES